MIEIKALSREQLKEAAKLSDATFRSEQQSSMAEAFPAIFDTDARQSFGAYVDGKLVSFMGVVPWTLAVGPAVLPVYSLGSVCTAPAWRAQGIAGKLLEHVYRHVEKAGACLLFVSGNRSLYTRAGCVRFGAVHRYRLSADLAAKLSAAVPATIRVRVLEPADWHEVSRLCESRPYRFQHSISELIRLIGAQAYASVLKLEQQLFVAEREGQLVGFAAIGVHGANHAGKTTVLEWAGEPAAIEAMFASIAQHEELVVSVPWQEHALHEQLAPDFVREEPALGTVCVIRPDRLLQRLYPWLEKRNPSADVTAVEAGEDGVVLRIDGHETPVLSRERFAELLFHPAPGWEGISPDLQTRLCSLFPIPLPSPSGLAYT